MIKNRLFVTLVVVGLILLPLSSSKNEKNDNVIVLSSENTMVLNSQVDGDSTSSIISKAKELDSAYSKKLKGRLGLNKNKPLYLFLNTPGGSVQSGLEMIEALRGLGRPVNTITLFAASMGFQIAQNLDTRYIIQNGVLMSHRAKGGFEGEFGGQFPSQIESRYALWKSRLDELDKQTVSRTGGKKTLESYQKQYASEMWLTGEQSVSQGYADQVVKVKCDESLSGTTLKEGLFLGMFKVQYELDNCPLNTSPVNVKMGFVTNQNGYMDLDTFISKGGQFGPSCLTESVSNVNKLCALDTSLNMEKVKELKATFVNRYESKAKTVVDMF
jgi:ATP-dependent Clp protease protease subunit